MMETSLTHIVKRSALLISKKMFSKAVKPFELAMWLVFMKSVYTVSHFSYAPLFQGPHFLAKMLKSNILYDNLFIDILSV